MLNMICPWAGNRMNLNCFIVEFSPFESSLNFTEERHVLIDNTGDVISINMGPLMLKCFLFLLPQVLVRTGSLFMGNVGKQCVKTKTFT